MAEQVLNDPANPPNNIPPGEFKMPTVEELLKALEGMDGLSEDNKQELKDSILSRANQENPFINPAAGGTVAGGKLMPDLLMLFSLIAIIILIFGVKIYSEMSRLKNIDKENLNVEELKEKFKDLVSELKNEMGDEFIQNIYKIIERKTNYYVYGFIICILVLILVFAFFGYKLYKSLVERERRKEEKKRLKQQKKKK